MSLTLIKKHALFSGELAHYEHDSSVNNCVMRFSIFLPPANAAKGSDKKFPVLYWLSGLTCNDENFMQKAGAQKLAAQLGIVIVAPDTSPRGEGVADDPQGAYDLGLGAGFYVNATESPWKAHYQMYDYIVSELPSLIEKNFAVNDVRSISGHSMGGHGALMIALKNTQRYQSVSAFSPVVNPLNCAWGEKAFNAYLGADKDKWKAYDSCELIAQTKTKLPLLIDQGEADEFLKNQLKPENFSLAAQQADYPITLRMQPDYDHSYYFIASFIDEHLNFHAKYLNAE